MQVTDAREHNRAKSVEGSQTKLTRCLLITKITKKQWHVGQRWFSSIQLQFNDPLLFYYPLLIPQIQILKMSNENSVNPSEFSQYFTHIIRS